jgi:hypothetical protein
MAHHRCWRLIHGELSRLAFSIWRFICLHTEKSFRTVWTELAQEFPEVFNHCAEQTLWNAARDSEMQRPLTRAEMIHRQQGISHEQIAEDRLWNKVRVRSLAALWVMRQRVHELEGFLCVDSSWSRLVYFLVLIWIGICQFCQTRFNEVVTCLPTFPMCSRLPGGYLPMGHLSPHIC